ncbi:DJ-1/PfpI family protein [Sphingobacterium kitahiroshimense]|uniref:DJ-1/PfpI family protein n=1 Tax=Sphingobacterium sp. B16(2022) TaxID=2914044 RepID=UPI0014393490|nr:DJ-1/PfpI family protein [Sphingobacterium sp. B16(2022)]NJI73260.1 DJ-1/PfpI family protein [Sphingobacterium sp. B16(2022)]
MKKQSSKSRRNFIQSLAAGTILLSLSPLVGVAQTKQDELPALKSNGNKLILGMVVFDGFQLLDVFGPLEMFGSLRDKVEILIIGERHGLVKSSAGPSVVIDCTFDEVKTLNILMVPGGGGTRREVNNGALIDAFKKLAESAPHVASICTGAAILAKTGLIDGLKATTNKRAFKWATSQSDKVTWVKEARWVEDGKFFTSSGISAGTDMALALIQKIFGRDTAIRIANGAEYEWNEDSLHDPFAKLNGLVD